MNAAGRQVGARAMRSTVTRGEYVLFYVLLAILAARPLIGEVFERVEISFVAAMEDAGGPRPLTTAWLDLLLLVTAWAAFTLRAGRWRSSLALVGTGALILGGALSLWHASDLHIAIFAGSSPGDQRAGGVGAGACVHDALAASTHRRRPARHRTDPPR